MKRKTKKFQRFPDYEQIDLGNVVTFGTSVYARKDKCALLLFFLREMYFI